MELDRDLLPLLRERFDGNPQVSFVQADVLDVDPQTLTGGQPYKVVANLPYYITSAVLRHFFEQRNPPTAGGNGAARGSGANDGNGGRDELACPCCTVLW